MKASKLTSASQILETYRKDISFWAFYNPGLTSKDLKKHLEEEIDPAIEMLKLAGY